MTNHTVKTEEFAATLPFKFKNAQLLKTVFVHRSFLNEKEAKTLGLRESNERLEFLGDAVLGAAVSDILYARYPATAEGELTRMRARLVNKKTLAGLALELGLPRYLRLGKGERASGGAENPTILASTFEAFIAAVYVELGFDSVYGYILELFNPLINEDLAGPGHFDFKPRLQELGQRVYKEAPSYRLVSETGAPHKKTFAVEAIIGGKVLGRGCAASKKEAEQAAAEEALQNLERLNKDS
ncbi:MAG: ribonuclease III [Deltaproteobacteria bacterium]|nr:ribonuclease III [Deltaproteobacteria bacterium]